MIKFHICTVKKHRFLKLPNCQCYFDYQQSILSEISEVIFLSKKMFSALDNEEQTAHSAFPLTSIIPDNKSLTNDLDTFFKRCYLFIFRERRREEERERNISVWLPLTCFHLGIWPATQVCALTGNWTSDPLVCQLTLNPLNHSSQGTNILISLFISYSIEINFLIGNLKMMVGFPIAIILLPKLIYKNFKEIFKTNFDMCWILIVILK